MTVVELIERLKIYPKDSQVILSVKWGDDKPVEGGITTTFYNIEGNVVILGSRA